MKKLFTLIAGMLLVSSGAFAQERWTNVITNGNMEGAADPMWSSFWVHDWRQGVEFDEASGQKYSDPSPNATVENPPCMFMGFAEIVEDPTNPGNHCARVIIRSKEEADATGTATTDDGNSKPDWTEWDSQFFVYALEPIPEGKEVRLTLKVRAEKAGSFQTQAHYDPGNYNHYSLFGDANYTTEWQTLELGPTAVDANHTQESNGKAFQSVAFNLSTMQDGNVIYFDDIKLEIRDPKDPAEFEGWFNFLRKGTLSDDKVKGTNYTNFTGRDGKDGKDQPARIVNDPIDGQPAMCVYTVGYEGVNKKYKFDEEGNPVIDEETGEQAYDEENYWTKQFTNEDGTVKDSTMTRAIDDWESQFFVSIPHEFKQGEKIKVKYWARADKPTSLDSQAHYAPGSYKHWAFIGSPELTEEWQPFEYEGDITSDQKGTWTIAFNCNKKKDEANTIYFRFDEFCINSAEVSENDRVLASEDVVWMLPVMGADDPSVMKLDLSKAVEILAAENATDLMDGVMKASHKDEEGNAVWEEIQPDYFIDAQGNWADDGINIAYDEDLTEGNVVGFNIYNDKTVVDGTVSTKLIFTKFEDSAEEGYARRGWNYQFNISLMGEEAYKEALGVATLNVVNKNTGAIYDLSGRKVTKAAKGLYIKDGKKFIVK